MRSTGAEQLRAVSRDLKIVGAPARGVRADLRKALSVAMGPMVAEVKRNAFAIPAEGRSGSTGLRVALMRATRPRVQTAGKNVRVGVIVDGSRMPADQQALPQLMEGERPWRHPRPGTDKWYPQAAHPFVAPAIPGTVARASVAVLAAIDSTAKKLSRGIMK